MVEPRKGNAGAGISGSEFAGLGIQFALVILVFTGAGVWLDKRLGTSPWLTILCLFIGAGGGFFSLYQKATAAQRREAEERARRRAESAGPPESRS
jgi:F0F1-type ATP synthase assembly protein I